MSPDQRNSYIAQAILSLMLVIILIGLFFAANIEKADALEPGQDPIEMEEGATFDGGVCWEADGTQGVTWYDGDCRTPADFDALHSYEALSQIPSQVFPDKSIAEVAGITPGSPDASVRRVVIVGVDYGTFAEYVTNLHSQVAL